MGGVTLVVKGETKDEVERGITAKLQEALIMGLYEDMRSEIIYDSQEKLFRAVLKIHT